MATQDISPRTIRDYLRGYINYHTGPAADVEAITESNIFLEWADLDSPLTDEDRLYLDATLGTKDIDDPPTPLGVLEATFAERLPRDCAREAARLTSWCLEPFLEKWDLTSRDPIPKGVAESLKGQLDEKIEDSAYERLRQHCE